MQVSACKYKRKQILAQIYFYTLSKFLQHVSRARYTTNVRVEIALQ